MESGQSMTCAEAFASRLAENNKAIIFTGTYNSGSTRTKDALAFWKTIRDRRKVEDEDELWAVLKQCSSHENVLLHTVAKLESLPMRVFRRVLWFYNIDYQSLESCLRRLTLEQISGISETYEDLYGNEPKVPRCFTEGLYNTVQQCLPWERVAVDDLLNEDVKGKDLRLETKGALAFNFFGWDIGFHKYPKEETDEVLSSALAETFHSLHSVKVDEEKNFTTNKGEGGIYFFLYKTLRYNYLWRRNEKVVFDDKICPGIRYTIVAWIIFFFLSPLAFYVSMFSVHGTHWYSYLRDAFGLATPGILATVSIKYAILKLCHIMELGGDWIEEHFEEVNIDKEYWKELGETLGEIVMGVIIAFLFYLLWMILYAFFLKSVFSATLVMTFLGLYVFYIVHYEKWIWPTSLPLVGKPVALFVILKVLYDYHRDMVDFLISAKHFLSAVLIVMGEHIPTIILAVSAAGFFLTWKLISITVNHCVESNDYCESEKSVRAEKCYSAAVCGTWVLVALYFFGAIVFLQTVPKTSWHVGTLPASFLSISFFSIVFFEFFMMRVLEPKRLMAQQKIITGSWIYGVRQENFYRLMAKNQWIQRLENPLYIIEKLWKFADSFADPGEYRKFLSLDEKGFQLLKEYEKYFQSHKNFDRRVFLGPLIQGMPVKEAKRIFFEEIVKKARSDEKWSRAYDLTLGRIMRPIQKVGNWFWIMINSAQRIWKEFNEMCPLETPTKEIK